MAKKHHDQFFIDLGVSDSTTFKIQTSAKNKNRAPVVTYKTLGEICRLYAQAMHKGNKKEE